MIAFFICIYPGYLWFLFVYFFGMESALLNCVALMIFYYLKEDPMLQKTRVSRILGLSAPLIAFGCASSPDQPFELMGRAQGGIELAEQSGGRTYSSVALDRARSKLNQARQASENGEYELATRLAAEAELDAKLAVAQTDQAKAAESLRELQASILMLRQEVSGNPSPEQE